VEKVEELIENDDRETTSEEMDDRLTPVYSESPDCGEEDKAPLS
ncbi:hypothetical protein AVEN_128256-1, partial [Araneus ventricosus]